MSGSIAPAARKTAPSKMPTEIAEKMQPFPRVAVSSMMTMPSSTLFAKRMDGSASRRSLIAPMTAIAPTQIVSEAETKPSMKCVSPVLPETRFSHAPNAVMRSSMLRISPMIAPPMREVSIMSMPTKERCPSAPTTSILLSAPPSPRKMTTSAHARMSVAWKRSARKRPPPSPSTPPIRTATTFASTPIPGIDPHPFKVESLLYSFWNDM